jgi:hypothetical protein
VSIAVLANVMLLLSASFCDVHGGRSVLPALFVIASPNRELAGIRCNFGRWILRWNGVARPTGNGDFVARA